MSERWADEIEAWSELPQAARKYVYNVLSREFHESARKASEAELATGIALLKGSVEPVSVRNVAVGVVSSHHLIADALAMALVILHDEDAEYCDSCGELHEPGEEIHGDPKGVS